MKKVIVLCSLTGLWFYASAAPAVQISDNVTLNGFATIGATQTSADNLGYRTSLDTDNVVYDDWNFASRSLAGVQGNIHFNPEWASTVQFIEHHTSDNTIDNSVQLAMVSYTPSPEWAFQLGRFSPKISMLTDNMNIGYGHLWTHSPVESYGQFLVSTIDGIDASYIKQIGDDTLKNVLTLGRSPSTYSTAQTEMSITGQLMGYTAEYTHSDWLFRTSIFTYKHQDAWVNSSLMSGLSQASAYWPEASELYDELDVKGSRAYLYSLGASYNSSDWQIQSEISQLKTDKQAMFDCISGYLSVGRHIGDFTPYVMYSRVHTTSQPYQLQSDPGMFASLATPAVGYLSTQYEQKNIALGVRWDITQNLALKTQWERTFVAAGNNVLWWNNTTGQSHNVDIYTIDLDFMF
jgi:hypothetical protein